MTWRRRFLLAGGGLLVGLALIVLLNSSLGVDRDETHTDLHRPEIVGESGSTRP